ncbi:MAG: flippase-like domain-containing protein [Candidatus Cloacimonetes bacterium]|nr:flippase-like domain-containing protein [Candidatus Cloacimonadota bacterium]MCF7814501.1 flippase-like domain-containing protein [Candidatus Cloacimonadota bacterium]MCF7869064.1 flippase-like domain-containing protein [Candidatus Cloacimonadota bacterium]MCF7884459.1 flippase-like domain-containing protein [Candidatus Cloacimonadota bacterium]
MKNKFNWLGGILLGIIFLIAWLRIVNWQEFLSYFHKFDLKYVLFFSGFYVLAYIFRSLRWRIILMPIYKMKILESFFLFMSGMLVNYLIPVRAGEFVKSIILKKKHNVRISASLPSVFIDKITDLFPIILIMILIPLIAVELNTTLKIVILVLFVIFLAFIAFLFFAVNHRPKAIKILHFILKIIPKNFREKFEDFFENFVDGMAIMKGRKLDYIKIYFITLLAVFSEAIYIFAVFKAFGAQISYPQILFGYTLMNLTYILPTPPAQIGSNQFMWVLIFGFALSVDKNLTSAAVTFSHLLTSIWIFGLGAISLLALNVSPKELVIRKKA